MKELKIILVVLLIITPIFGVYRYTEALTPVWTATAAQQSQIDLQANTENARTDVQSHAERAQLITGALSGFGSVLLLILIGAGGVYVWRVYDQRKESWARAVDGAFALQPFNHAGQTWVIDPNKSIFGVIGQDKRTGAITTDASLIGPDRQLKLCPGHTAHQDSGSGERW